MSAAEFGTLPPSGRGGRSGGPWSEVVETLKGRPGEWAKVATGKTRENASATVGYLKRNYSLEATQRTADDGTCDVWARFVPEVSS